MLGAEDARRQAVEQKLSAIWQTVNQKWRDHGQQRVPCVEVGDVSPQSLAPPVHALSLDETALLARQLPGLQALLEGDDAADGFQIR